MFQLVIATGDQPVRAVLVELADTPAFWGSDKTFPHFAAPSFCVMKREMPATIPLDPVTALDAPCAR